MTRDVFAFIATGAVPFAQTLLFFFQEYKNYLVLVGLVHSNGIIKQVLTLYEFVFATYFPGIAHL